MTGSDGTLYFNTRIDDSGLQADMVEIKNRANAATDAMTTGFAGAVRGIRSTRGAISLLIRNVANFGKMAKATREARVRFDELDSSILKTKENIELLKAQMNNLGDNPRRGILQKNIELDKRAIKEMEAEISELKRKMNDPGSLKPFERTSLETEISTIEKQITEAKAEQAVYEKELETIEQERVAQHQALNSQIAQENAKLSQAKAEQQQITEDQANMATGMSGGLIGMAVVLGVMAIKKQLEQIKKIAKAVLKLYKEFGKITLEIGKSMARFSIGAFVAGLKAVYAELTLINSVTKGILSLVGTLIKDLIGTSQESIIDFLSAANGETSKWSGLLHEVQIRWQLIVATLGKALQNVFYPLLQVINYVLQGLQRVTSYFAQITGAIFGDTSNMAAGLSDISLSSDDANKSVQDLNETLDETKNGLAGFDKLNVLNQDENSSTDFDAVAEQLKAAASDELIEIGKSSFIEAIKEAVKNGDWKGVGKLIGKKLEASLKGINWTNIKKNAKKTANNIAKTINGFLEGWDWKVLGKTIAEGFNTAFTFLAELIKTTNWTQLGIDISETILGFLTNFDINEFVGTLTSLFNALVDTTSGFVKDFGKNNGWSKLGNALGESLTNYFKGIKLKEAGLAIGTALNGLLVSATELLTYTDESGTPIWEIIAGKLADGISGFFQGLVGNDNGQAMIDAIKNSLSAVIGGVATLFTDIGNDFGGWFNIGSSLGEGLSDALSDNSWFGSIVKAIKTIITSIVDLVTGFVSGLDPTVFIDSMETLINNIFDTNNINKLIGAATRFFWLFATAVAEALKSSDSWFLQTIGNIIGSQLGYMDLIAGFSGETITSASSGGNLQRDVGNGEVTDSFGHVSGKFEELGEEASGSFKTGYTKNDLNKIKPSDIVPENDKFKESGTASGVKYAESFKTEVTTKGKVNTTGMVSMPSQFNAKGKESGQKYDSGVSTGINTNKAAAKTSATALGNDITTSFGKSIDRIPEVMESTFREAWNRVKAVFNDHSNIDSITMSITTTFEDLLNNLIDGLNNALVAPFNSLNNALDTLRWWSLDGDRPFGGLPYITMPDIPKLATGMYVPANYGQFMATLGDARVPEVVSPVPMMKQAMREVLSEYGGSGGGSYTFIAQIDGKTVFEQTVRQDEMYKLQHGHSAFGG